jgi:hypothetical protein
LDFVGRDEIEVVVRLVGTRCCGQIESMTLPARPSIKILLTVCAVQGPMWISNAVISRA